MACGIFPDQRSNPCLLHWQADSLPLGHQGSPGLMYFYIYVFMYFKGKFPCNNLFQIFLTVIEYFIFQKRIIILKFQFKSPVRIWLGLQWIYRLIWLLWMTIAQKSLFQCDVSTRFEWLSVQSPLWISVVWFWQAVARSHQSIWVVQKRFLISRVLMVLTVGSALSLGKRWNFKVAGWVRCKEAF